MSYPDAENCPFNEVLFFIDMFKREMDEKARNRENAKSGRKMVDLKSFMT